jgi:hypothetical protein
LSEYNAKWAWIATGIFVVVHNIMCPPGGTMSEKFDEWIEEHPVLARTVVVVVAGHIINVWPERLDPVHQVFVILSVRKNPNVC